MSFTREYTTTEPTREEVARMAGPVLLEFGAPWCGWCQAVQEVLEGLLEKHPEVRHVKIHDSRGRPLGRSFRVKLWPSFVFLVDGQVVGQTARPDEAELIRWMATFAG